MRKSKKRDPDLGLTPKKPVPSGPFEAIFAAAITPVANSIRFFFKSSAANSNVRNDKGDVLDQDL